MQEVQSPVRYEPAVRRPRSAQTRARLLRSALSLFWERGYHGAGTNEIGAAAGLSGPSIYRHFATKDDMLVAGVLDGAEKLAAGAIAAQHETDPRRGLELLCASFVEVALKYPEVLGVYFYESRHVPAEAKVELDQSGRRYLHHYERRLASVRPDLSAQEVQLRVVAASQMIAGTCTDLPKVPKKALKDSLTKRMLAALLADMELEPAR
ncbi:MAG TPA: TetR/AcrR family transcriptional regulator [Acidimicrobiales bacterium]|jgi:AcrR family transcriptional regulator